MRKLLLAVGLGLMAGGAQADVITFNGVGPGVGSHPVSTPYTELNYSISAPNGLYYLGTADPRYAGDNNLFNSNYWDTTTLTTIDGNLFAIHSIDLAQMYYYGLLPPIEPTTFTGTLAGGATVTQTFNVGNSSFQTYLFGAGFSGLTSISWTATTETPQFANIHVSTIPEPSSALLLGLGLVGMAARRRVQ